MNKSPVDVLSKKARMLFAAGVSPMSKKQAYSGNLSSRVMSQW